MVPAMTKPNIKQFDIVSDHSDHHYSNYDEKQGKNKRNNSEDYCFINSDSTVYKAIMREWNILENNLPDTIYVRAYETRVDLMRAAIVGAAGTPYHDALFVFDIKFPPDYPNRPPHIHYWSYERCRPNPCLRRTGGVWMSLLNTGLMLWTTGWGEERWVPSQSTILQVLESIQMFVLNDKPLYNDKKAKLFDKVIGAKSFIPYNTEAFIETCKSTVYLLRHPPKYFEGIIADHYRSKACDVLRAYIAYANGRMRVGHYYNNEIDVAMAAENNSRYCNVSELERRDMEKLYPLLVQEFEKTGFSAQDWVKEDLFSEEMIMEPFLVFIGSFFSDCLSKCLRPCPCLPCLPWNANHDDDRDHPLLAIKKAT